MLTMIEKWEQSVLSGAQQIWNLNNIGPVFSNVDR